LGLSLRILGQYERKKTVAAMFKRILQMRIKAYLIGRPSSLSFAKGIVVSVSSVITTIVKSISCGSSVNPANPANVFLNSHKIEDSKIVERNSEILAVLYMLF
jgi:hypothetical protein